MKLTGNITKGYQVMIRLSCGFENSHQRAVSKYNIGEIRKIAKDLAKSYFLEGEYTISESNFFRLVSISIYADGEELMMLDDIAEGYLKKLSELIKA
jgi:hypothetical protein